MQSPSPLFSGASAMEYNKIPNDIKDKEEADGMYAEKNGGQDLERFGTYLRREERSAGTVEKYLRDARRFSAWLGERPVSKENAALWKEELCALGYQAGTVNTMLSAVNRFLSFLGRSECRVRYLRIQRRIFRGAERELTRQDYGRLLEAAQELRRGRLALLLETICATGIRVSEVKYITVDAARAGRAEVAMKGKIRTILLPGKLCRKLLKYAKGQKTASGEIFLTRSGKSISRCQIWSEMKALCAQAGVAPSKVFPHNLRHLFARTFYKVSRDIVRLADVLGHSCIETTRIYLVSTGAEHARQMDRLGLLL